MDFQWDNCSQELRDFVHNLLIETSNIIEGQVIGCYLHGSLVMGGFNPDRSDIDLLVVTEQPLRIKTKRELAQFFLRSSKKPYPVEISILNLSQLENWQYPTPYDFHFSEYWRRRYEEELQEETALYLNDDEKKDVDLAAHFMILNKYGKCLTGRPIHQVFPAIPASDFLSSILEDYDECLQNILVKPVYCTLNLLRVYWYLKDGTISSKKEAGEWGAEQLPEKFQLVINQALKEYGNANTTTLFNKKDLFELRDYVNNNVQELL
ncbi:aminoglycoside adenylyltransferase domain-containing protein [Planococcus shixiaomingii]|uniref:aminoglycoside adenylyltransferase domain-containing protein n=1 Tax=Planococcus shixiaomingii TaxID=3058393 RepID=UPI002614C7F3|nr:aminoglycoside adenylyltransferase domain-containing protein [Planococcus sp. N022]WKA56633.1 DUF4111 domain-containing protein [Planococcus sp. N022]